MTGTTAGTQRLQIRGKLFMMHHSSAVGLRDLKKKHLSVWTYTSVHSKAKTPLCTLIFVLCTVKRNVGLFSTDLTIDIRLGTKMVPILNHLCFLESNFADCSPHFRLFLKLCCVWVKNISMLSLFSPVYTLYCEGFLQGICWTESRVLYEQYRTM